MKSYRILSLLLAIILLFTGLVSVISGAAMIATNGIGMPQKWLEGTVFSSYLIPALILAIVIGGVSILAGILLIMKKRLAIEVSAASGFGLLIWIFTEMYLIRESHFLQTIIFIEAIAILIICFIMLRLLTIKKQEGF